MTTIPVYLESDADTVRAECVRCGKCAEVAISKLPEDGTKLRRLKDAKTEVLAEITEACAERLPLGAPPGIPPHHYERAIPRGLALYAEDVHGKLWELSVNKSGKLETVAIGCHYAADVVVVPETRDDMEAAVEFSKDLVKRGYKRARAVRVGYAEQQTAGAKS